MSKNPDWLIYADDDIIIVNKPYDLLSIPDRHDTTKMSMQGQLKKRYDEVFTVHRLDRETSGIMVFARNAEAHRNLSMQFEARTSQKIYHAILDGTPAEHEGIINRSIGPHPTIAGKMMATTRGKASETHYRVLQQFRHFSLVEADIKTGRTHQIRVHFQSIGHPLAVDALYSPREALMLSEFKKKKFSLGKYVEEQPIMSRTTLHAARLTFEHPSTLERVHFEVAAPKDFLATLTQLGKWDV